jgi:formylglycine-generating enzyme required for sulfatase activity
MPHIFISYAKKDTQELAFALDDALNALDGVTSWVDRSIKAGQNWDSLIQKEIRRCDYLVVLYSPDINRHLDDEDLSESFVIKEMKYAQQRRKTIIPIMVKLTDLPIDFINIQYIDYIGEGMNLSQLVEKVMDSLPKSHINVASPQKIITFSRKSPLELLPQPFTWINIPAGSVVLKNDIWIKDNYTNLYVKNETIVNIPTFEISKYPITNLQFKQFIDSGGYEEKDWWTKVGWENKYKGWRVDAKDDWHPNNSWSTPCFFDNPKFNQDNQPVVGVSWYEAVAFCLWLSDVTGEKITLPSNAQWQRAAQGDDKRRYPWGNDWNTLLCNNNEHGLNRTTLVTEFEGKGNSPFGVVDMAGNIWEWCSTAFLTGSDDIDGGDIRLWKGGSWKNKEREMFRVSLCRGVSPIVRYDDWGFRIVRLPK